jgi:hypothetical protein
MGDTVRTHFVLPRELLARFDAHVPSRKRSEVVAELMAEYVRRERATEIMKWAGFVKAEDHPEWETAEDIDRWVRALRDEYKNPWDEIEREEREQRGSVSS